MTDAPGHGTARPDGTVLSAAAGWGQQTSLCVDPNQIPRRIGEPEDEQRVPERIPDESDGFERFAGDEGQSLGCPGEQPLQMLTSRAA